MPERNTSNNTSNSDMDVIIVLDKDQLPEELRDKLPQDLQKKLIELLRDGVNPQQDLSYDQSYPHGNKRSSNLFAVHHGTVVGNIYKDGIVPEEKPTYKTKSSQDKLTI